jgi:predicted nucleic acid-binding protein
VPFYQFDASAIVKRYVDEIGSGWVGALVDASAGNVISIADVTRAEVVSAVARRGREGTLDADVAAESLRTFDADSALQYRVVPTDYAIVSLAIDLLLQHPLRAYDAIQLATVLHVNQTLLQRGLPPLVFVTADDELLAAAGTEGLAAENPNQHP